MASLFHSLSIVALAAVALVLLLGLWNMLGAKNTNRSQLLMRWRVGLQFVAICILAAAVYFLR